MMYQKTNAWALCETEWSVQADAWLYCSKAKLVSLLMQDTKGAVGKLEMIFALLIHAIFGLTYLAIFNVSSSMPRSDLPAAPTNHDGMSLTQRRSLGIPALAHV